MGAKHASIHFRTDKPNALISKLKKEFRKKKGPSMKELVMLQFISIIAKKNIDSISDKNKKAEKEAILDETIRKAKVDMGEGESVVIVIRPHFVSMYWYGNIRVENLDEFLYQYTGKVKVPALGVAVYDDDNFVIHAVRKYNWRQLWKSQYLITKYFKIRY